MNTAVIKINSLDQALMLSRAYKEGEIKLNVSKLARELNCSRKTLSRRLNGIAPKKTRNRKRYLDDYKHLIYKYLCDEQRNFDYIDHIYYFMKREHGITCTRSTFFRYIKDNEELSKKFKNNKTNSFVERFETAPGQQAQFDMKEKVKLTDKNGTQTVVYIPTLTLSWSRYNYRQVILKPTTDNLLIFLAQTFEEIGGVPKELVIDNLKAFVEKPRQSAKDKALLNSKFEEFCKDYGITPMPCMPYRPQTKGKTETQNKIVDQLKNYNGYYSGLSDIHDKLEKINSEDNERPSQATRLPRNFLLEKEKGDLLPLPSKEIRSKYHLKLNEVYVTNESLFQYKYNKYSLPQEYIGKRVGLAVQNKELLIYYNGKIIEKHPITNNKFNIKEEHKLYYKKTDKQAIKESNQIILKELENIIYDND